MNLDNMFGDCEDLNTTRGGSLAVLRIGAEVARQLGDKVIRVVSSGSSQGLLLMKGESRTDVEQTVRTALGGLPLTEHATVMVTACEFDEGSFARQRAELKAGMRWSQMRSPSVVYPRLHGALVCDIDKVRPALRRPDLERKQNQSDFTYARRKRGREQKKALVREILSEAAPADFDVVSELGELAADKEGRFGGLADKLAVLRFDGNHFGKRADGCVSPDAIRDFSETTQAQQIRYFRALVPPITDQAWWTADGQRKLRLEIVVYGGDEVTLVTPAWLGWKALRVFYEQAAGWQPLTYSGGLVFCHRNAPIHAIKRLATDLADEAKERGGRDNFAIYQALESFDAIGEDLDDFLARRYRFTEGRGTFLGLKEIALIDDNMEYWRATLSRRKLHALVQGLERGRKVNVEEGIAELVESKSPGSDEALQAVKALRSRLGDAALLHILELWDYAGVQL
jgi:hypothetical protein